MNWWRWRWLNFTIFLYTSSRLLPARDLLGCRRHGKNNYYSDGSQTRCCTWWQCLCAPFLYLQCGGWHRELLDEAASHADVLFADKILPELDAYVQQVRSLKNVAKRFEVEETEVLVRRMLREEARLGCCCCCFSPWSWVRLFRCFSCCRCFSLWKWMVAPVRRCFLRRRLGSIREKRRAELMAAALAETVDAPTRRRLKEEEALSEGLRGISQVSALPVQ
jgi:hypothetical protein